MYITYAKTYINNLIGYSRKATHFTCKKMNFRQQIKKNVRINNKKYATLKTLQSDVSIEKTLIE